MRLSGMAMLLWKWGSPDNAKHGGKFDARNVCHVPVLSISEIKFLSDHEGTV